jgi:polysaccharide pyruvyl transferase WcaK-like protein
MAWRRKFWNSNSYLRAILDARAILDITGGDSFSDIYGLRRMILGSLRKMLVLLLDKDLVLLPQTYGPFSSSLARSMARWILRRASGIFSRDQEGLNQIIQLVGPKSMRTVPRFCPDVAFTLDSIPPAGPGKLPGPFSIRDSGVRIGLNVSGLLFHGGYTRDNMFGLGVDYKQLVTSLIERMLEQRDTTLLLIPHVFPESDFAVESDPVACRQVYAELTKRFPDRLFLLEGTYDQSEIKWIIGQCDFFIGSRMHACIAALSQSIPAVGLAYSKKFQGVFDSVGAGELVVDLRSESTESVLDRVQHCFERRQAIAHDLRERVTSARLRIEKVFDSLAIDDSAKDPL